MRNSHEKSLIRPFRRAAIAGATFALACFAAADAQQAVSSKLAIVDHAMMPSTAQIQNWLDQKDSWGPAYTAGPGWKKFMGLIHAEMKSMGMANVGDYPYPRVYRQLQSVDGAPRRAYHRRSLKADITARIAT